MINVLRFQLLHYNGKNWLGGLVNQNQTRYCVILLIYPLQVFVVRTSYVQLYRLALGWPY